MVVIQMFLLLSIKNMIHTGKVLVKLVGVTIQTHC